MQLAVGYTTSYLMLKLCYYFIAKGGVVSRMAVDNIHNREWKWSIGLKTAIQSSASVCWQNESAVVTSL